MDATDPLSTHCTDDDLVLFAIGEPMSTPEAEAHLAACSVCSSRADQLRAVVATGRAVTPDDRPVTPPPTLWEGVARAVRADDPPARVVSIRNARSRRRVLGAVAAAAAVVLVAALAVTAPWSDTGSGPSVTAATIALAPVGSSTAHGEAVMTAGADGSTMTVTVPDLPATDQGFYEVWLMGGPTQLISLGVLDSHHQGTFPVPDNVDVARYPYIDISLEPLDGNPAHSNESVVRGSLPA